MAEPFLGEIRHFSFNFAPSGWAQCNGQVLPINQNQALFTLLATAYGGNGTTNFALPDLRGRAPVHQGQGPGLSSYAMGQAASQETVTLTIGQLPAHTHGSVAAPACSLPATQTDPAGRCFGVPADGSLAYAPTAGVKLGGVSDPSITEGGSQAHSNLQPYLTGNFCIALVGIYPSPT